MTTERVEEPDFTEEDERIAEAVLDRLGKERRAKQFPLVASQPQPGVSVTLRKMYEYLKVKLPKGQ